MLPFNLIRRKVSKGTKKWINTSEASRAREWRSRICVVIAQKKKKKKWNAVTQLCDGTGLNLLNIFLSLLMVRGEIRPGSAQIWPQGAVTVQFPTHNFFQVKKKIRSEEKEVLSAERRWKISENVHFEMSPTVTEEKIWKCHKQLTFISKLTPFNSMDMCADNLTIKKVRLPLQDTINSHVHN